LLVHEDPAVVEADIQKIRQMEENNEMIEYEHQVAYLK